MTSNPIPENRPGSRDFSETMENFERSFIRSKVAPAREKLGQVPRGVYYCDGKINELFCAYLAGIALARSIVNLELGD